VLRRRPENVPGAVAGATELRRLDLLHLRVLVQICAFPLHNHLGAAALRACVETPLILAHTSPSTAVARASVFPIVKYVHQLFR
jgi:hypothetical protein